MHMTGFPASGKTEFTKSLEAGFARAGIKCKVIVLIGSIREPQDFGGFPVSTPDGVRLLPMAWARDAQRLAEDGLHGDGLPRRAHHRAADDAGGDAAPADRERVRRARAADYEPGKGGVVYLCASNAVEWARAAGDPAADGEPLWHGEFPMDHERGAT
jgi:hypothetical protein